VREESERLGQPLRGENTGNVEGSFDVDS
jgi:hypothetical protein